MTLELTNAAGEPEPALPTVAPDDATEATPRPTPRDARERIVTMTQPELDDLIQRRIDRVREEYAEAGQRRWKAQARKWEDRCREATSHKNWWRDRAKENLVKVRTLEEVNNRLLNRLSNPS